MSRVAAALAVLGLAGAGGVVWAMSRQPPPPVLPVRDDRLLQPSGGSHPLDPRALEATARRLAQSVLGFRYSYGGGRTDRGWPQGWAGVHGGKGWDCSGLTLAWSALLLRYRWDAPDRGARDIDQLCTPVETGHQKVGDVAVYKNRHVTAVVTGPDASTGHSAVLSASGGGAQTNGDDPSAIVRLMPRGDYRRDFLRYARLPPVEVSDRQKVTCMAVHRLLAGQPVPEDPRLTMAELREELAHRYAGLDVVRTWLSAVSGERFACVSPGGQRRNATQTQAVNGRRA